MSLNEPTHRSTKCHHSLAKLLFVSHMSLATLLLISFAGVMFWMNYRAIYEKVESELLGAAEILDEQLAGGTDPQSLVIPDAFSHRFGRAGRDHAYWRLWDRDGNVLVSHGKVPRDVLPSQAEPREGDKRSYLTRKAGRHYALFIASSSAGQLLVGRPLAKEYDGFLRLFVSLLGIVAIGIGFAAIIAWRLVASIARPIESLAATISIIRHRELDRRLPIPQPTKEMTTLAIAVNAMLGDLQSAFEKQQKFTSDAAHELRTPVAIIQSQCELSLSKPRDDSSYRTALLTCRDVASHMSGLVNQLLLLSRLDAEEKPQLAVVSLDKVIAKAIEMIAPLACQNDVRIQSSLLPITVNADESQLRQIMLNLLANSIQFSHLGETVTVQLQRDGEYASLRVDDRGVGIAEEDIPYLCDRFFQVDQARTTTQSSGSGLGLSIVSEILQRIDGTLSIESKPGIGTIVHVLIPALRSQSIASENQPDT